MTAADTPNSLTYLRPATAAEESLVSRFRPVFERIAEGNVERERNRTFPFEQVQWLKDAARAIPP